MRDGYGSVNVHFGADTWFRCFTYPDKPEAGPILSIDTPGFRISLANAARGAVEAGDVDNARRLLEAVSAFTAEVERLHAQATDRAAATPGGERAA